MLPGFRDAARCCWKASIGVSWPRTLCHKLKLENPGLTFPPAGIKVGDTLSTGCKVNRIFVMNRLSSYLHLVKRSDF
jgi:hypothetical protein